MPLVERFRIIRPLPQTLNYLRASFALEVLKQPHETIPVDEWILRARKISVGTTCTIVSALAHRQRLLEQLESGFDVEAGSPPATIMARLVADGYAEKSKNYRR